MCVICSKSAKYKLHCENRANYATFLHNGGVVRSWNIINLLWWANTSFKEAQFWVEKNWLVEHLRMTWSFHQFLPTYVLRCCWPFWTQPWTKLVTNWKYGMSTMRLVFISFVALPVFKIRGGIWIDPLGENCAKIGNMQHWRKLEDWCRIFD